MADPTPNPAPTPDPAPNPAPSPAPDPQPNPAPATDWRDAITDNDLKVHAKNFTSVTDLAKGHFELRKKLSSAIVPPGKDAKPEDIAAYRTKIGVPESAAGYKFVMPDGRQASDADKAFQAKMAETFHGLNVPAETAAGLNKVWNEMQVQAVAAHVQALKDNANESLATLKKEWGADERVNMEFANRGAETGFGRDFDAARQLMDANGKPVLDNPLFLKMFAKLGREMGEDGLRGSMTDADRATARDQIADLTQQIHNARDRNDRITMQRLVAKRTELTNKAFPGDNRPPQAV